MPYNGSGVFSIINTFIPGTVISSSQMNANLGDIATGLTDALTRDGQAGMTAPLKIISGTVTAPALAFSSEPTTGFYRPGAGAVTLTILGSPALAITSAGATVTGDLTITGNFSLAGTFGINALTVTSGPIIFSGEIAPTSLSADQNDWAPTGIATAFAIDITSSNNVAITGIVTAPAGTTSTPGRKIQLRNKNAAGGKIITLIPNDASSAAGNRFLFPFPVSLTPGQSFEIIGDASSTGWNSVSQIVTYPPVASYSKLVVTNDSGTPNSIVNITADYFTVWDGAGNAKTIPAVSLLTVNISTSGVNGLDTGTVANNTAYFIHIVYNPSTNVVGGIFSLSATAPTLPTGYSMSGRCSWQHTDTATTNLRRITQRGKDAQYVVGAAVTTAMQVINSATIGTVAAAGTAAYVSTSVAGLVPSTAAKITVASLTFAGGSFLVAPNTAYSGFTSANPPPMVGTGATANITQVATFVLETLAIGIANSGGTQYCVGWEDNL